MRSIATPNDHIDMKNSTKATALATSPICAHIAIKSTVHPPSVYEVNSQQSTVNSSQRSRACRLSTVDFIAVYEVNSQQSTVNSSQRSRACRLSTVNCRLYCSVKFTVTVMMTGTGTPLSSVGVNCHWRTASSAAASSSGIERSTLASCTLPFGPIVASMITTPCTRADCAMAGYTGLTSLTFVA